MANQGVRVRFTRDLPSATSVGGFLVPASRGPLRQRDVELAPGEELTVPADVARVLEEGGYVSVVADTEGG